MLGIAYYSFRLQEGQSAAGIHEKRKLKFSQARPSSCPIPQTQPRIIAMNIIANSDSADFPPARSPSSQTAEKAQSKAGGPDILRSLAVLLVMLLHLPVEATPSSLVSIRTYVWVGIDIFFVLRGFLIGTQLFKEVSQTGSVDLKSFYLRRAFRILSAFFVVLGLYSIFPVLRDAFAVYLRDVYYPTHTRLDGLMFGVILAAGSFFKPELYKRYAPPRVALPVGIAFVVTALVLLPPLYCFQFADHLTEQISFSSFRLSLVRSADSR
ncbi:acyltransferase family protein [Agrobacterium vitis]|uniref:acyltransferase family protein n=1 Tax=Agrobacterium vitis TaxID=373 RepID=UPI001F2D48A1|nr:acyltransferase [Agrobacterium vitis]